MKDLTPLIHRKAGALAAACRRVVATRIGGEKRAMLRRRMLPMGVPPALLFALALWSATPFAQGAGQEVHGTSDAFAGNGVAIAWGVLRGATEETTMVTLRIAADPAAYTHVAADGIDPFSKRRVTVAAERRVGTVTDIRIPRAGFADTPRTELRFSSAGPGPTLVVYYMGVPDTTPEFAAAAKLEAHLAERIARLRADMGRKMQ